MTRKVKSGSSFCPMRNSANVPAASNSTRRNAVKLPCLMAQRDRLKPRDALEWVIFADTDGHSGASTVRLRCNASACCGLRTLSGEPDAHALAKKLHARGHH